MQLGRSREEVRAAMAQAGFPLEESSGRSDYFCDASIQTECGMGGSIDFVGVSYSPTFVASYRGINVFATGAEELFRLIAEADGSGSHRFVSSEYCFPNQIVTLWDADPQYDRISNESKSVWAQVGLGNQAYAAAVAKILADA